MRHVWYACRRVNSATRRQGFGMNAPPMSMADVVLGGRAAQLKGAAPMGATLRAQSRQGGRLPKPLQAITKPSGFSLVPQGPMLDVSQVRHVRCMRCIRYMRHTVARAASVARVARVTRLAYVTRHLSR